MEREPVTKWDFEAAFKALDDINIDMPAFHEGFKPNRDNLKEMFNPKKSTDVLVEDYYNINDQKELEEAKGDREAEIAKAKLARIEKIVDLNAETEDDLLPSYAGKIIVQCPQCMTLFYKDPKDIERSEDNPDVVNINEKCQHCGNISGYNIIGKVAAIAEKPKEENTEETDELNLDMPEPAVEDPTLTDTETNPDLELPEPTTDEEESTEETEETPSEEDIESDLGNVEDEVATKEETTEEEPAKEEEKEEDKEKEDKEKKESLETTSLNEDTKKLANGKWANVGKDGKVDSGTFKTKKEADAQRRAMFAENKELEEADDLEFDLIDDSDIKECKEGLKEDGLDTLLNSKEFKTPISDAEVKNIFNSFKENLKEDCPHCPEEYTDIDITDIDDASCIGHFGELSKQLVPSYDKFNLQDCCLDDEDKITISGIILLKKDNEQKPVNFVLTPNCTEKDNIYFDGECPEVCNDNKFKLNTKVKDGCLIIESIEYKKPVREHFVTKKTIWKK